MHPTDVASAAWVFASAPSKVPFYVAGGVLAGWAVVLAAVGVSRAGFPSSPVAARMVMATSVVLVAATISAAVLTAGEETGARGAGTAGSGKASGSLQLAADPTGNLAYDRQRASIGHGRVTIRFVNRSPLAHNVTIAKGGTVVAKTRTITGATTATTAELPPGTYVFYCSVDGHRQGGMHGTLTVR